MESELETPLKREYDVTLDKWIGYNRHCVVYIYRAAMGYIFGKDHLQIFYSKEGEEINLDWY
jgi:hypothetical protein